MTVEVILQVGERGVSFGTFVAFKRFFVGVGGQDVRFEGLRLREGAFAYLAFIRFELVVSS